MITTLSPKEKEAFKMLKRMKGNDLTSVGIRKMLKEGKFYQIVKELKEQGEDKKQSLEWLIGTENAQLIMSL